KSRLRLYSSRLRLATAGSWSAGDERQWIPAVEPGGDGDPRRPRRQHLVLDERGEKADEPVEPRLDVDGRGAGVEPEARAVLGAPARVGVIDEREDAARRPGERVAVALVGGAGGVARDLHVEPPEAEVGGPVDFAAGVVQRVDEPRERRRGGGGVEPD